MSLTIETFDDNQHQCVSHREGDWIIFLCPVCRDYERRINWKTREMKVRRGASTATHAGSHAPVEASENTFCQN